MTKKVGDKLVYEEVFLIDNYIIFPQYGGYSERGDYHLKDQVYEI